MKLLTLLFAVTLAGCGLSETATVAATAGAAKAKEAEQAKNAPAQVQGKLDEAFRQADQKRDSAEGR